jgi:hypothetical protein
MISSAEQAMDALLKAREMSARVRAEYAALSTSFSLEGRVLDATLLDVEIEGTDANLRLSPLDECRFSGELTGNGLELLITLRGADIGERWRCKIEGSW